MPDPLPTVIVMPVAAPATFSALRAGTLAEAKPVPAMVRSELKSPGMKGLVFVAF